MAQARARRKAPARSQAVPQHDAFNRAASLPGRPCARWLRGDSGLMPEDRRLLRTRRPSHRPDGANQLVAQAAVQLGMEDDKQLRVDTWHMLCAVAIRRLRNDARSAHDPLEALVVGHGSDQGPSRDNSGLVCVHAHHLSDCADCAPSAIWRSAVVHQDAVIPEPHSTPRLARIPSRQSSKDRHLGAHRHGQPLQTPTHLKPLAAALDIPDLTFQSLRRSFATLMQGRVL